MGSSGHDERWTEAENYLCKPLNDISREAGGGLRASSEIREQSESSTSISKSIPASTDYLAQ